MHRLFFALVPPADVAGRISTRADSLALDGRPVAIKRIHLTLAFLGVVESHTVNALCAAAAQIDVPAFTLVLDRLGCFVGPQIAWFGPSKAPAELLDLARKLDKNTAAAIDNLRYRPHVSVRRKTSGINPAPIAPIEWVVNDFSLFASGEGGRAGAYRELGRWPLRPRPVGRHRL